jgi:nanoRNase/pAp phosphatase (c-di-AMP/oligoRNAs hydrolase)
LVDNACTKECDVGEDDGKKPDQLAEILSARRQEKHVIVVQDYPDPDAISSAFAHKLISSALGIDCDIVYGGKISHHQNLALVKLLGIELLPFDASIEWSQYGGAVFVDNQGTTAERTVKFLEEAAVSTLIVVDHHELQPGLMPLFADVRTGYGATATIYSEYLENGLLKMDKSRRDHVLLATALMHGLITDTNGLIRASVEDFHAAGFLSSYRDPDLLEQIMNQARPKKTMEVVRAALENRTVAEGFSIAGVGYLRTEDRDVVPQAADFLVTEENVHTAIVYGIVTGMDSDEVIVGSLRTRKLALDPDQFIKEVFGKDAMGSFYGGGKASAGGFKIPAGFLSGGDAKEYKEEKWHVFDAQIKQKLTAKTGVQNHCNNTEK